MKEKEQFLIVPYTLLMAAGYISKGGEQVKMNLSEKLVYSYIRDRFQFFTKAGKEYYDTQQAIADVLNLDIKTTGNILRKFIKNGLTGIYKKPYGNFVKNVYVSVPELCLWYKGKSVPSAAKQTQCIDDLYVIPNDFSIELPDIGYRRECEFEIDSCDLVEMI